VGREGLESGGIRADLVVVALPGVQRFLEEARSTSDVSAASGIYSALAGRVVDSLGAEPGGQLVLPVRDAPSPGPDVPRSGQDGELGLPNRIVALLPPGSGAAAARRASDAVQEAWQGWVRQVMRPAPGDPQPQTPGFPRVYWVCIPERPGGSAGAAAARCAPPHPGLRCRPGGGLAAARAVLAGAALAG
jgi:CRISPR-associated protein Cmr2